MTRQRNDASQSQKGIRYQYLQTLKYCFLMRSRERIYIEVYGDVSTANSQIEVKNYSDPLTDLHENFWKTLRNWMDDSFSPSNYSYLLLLTTQIISANSKFNQWNKSNTTEKRDILFEIRNKFFDQKTKSSIIQNYLEFVLAPEKNDRLMDVLSRLWIAAAQPNESDLWNELKAIYAKHIAESARNRFIECLLGHLLSPSVCKEQSISFEDFSKLVQDITKDYMPQTRIFPKVSYEVSLEEQKKHHERPYVKKIRDIEYHGVVNDAITDHLRAMRNIQNDFQDRITTREKLSEYEAEITRAFNDKRRVSMRKIKGQDIIAASQDFYDFVTDPPSIIPFIDYNDTPKYFQNGILHGIIDENTDMLWLLAINGEKNEQNG